MQKIKVLIVDDIAQTRTDLRRLLYFEEDLEVVGEAGNGEEAIAQVEKLQPDIVLMDINMPVMNGITATEKITNSYPSVAVVMISIQGEQEYLKKAMIAGARDYLVKPVTSEEIANTLRQVYALEVKRRHSAPDGDRTAGGDLPKKSKIISIFSGKGGVGKSVLATNLAVSLAKQQKEVALLDLDLQFGDLSVLLNLSEIRCINELVEESAGITERTLSHYLMRHLSGTHLLSAPIWPQDAERVTDEHIQRIITLLQERFEYIIMDTPAAFHDISLCALEQADLILLILLKDVSTVKNAKTAFNILQALGYEDKTKLILNMDGPGYGVETADVEKSLGLKLYHSIPRDDKQVIISVNKGVPFTLAKTSCDVARSVNKLAEMLSFSGMQADRGTRQSVG